jgi:multidrug efflux pump subunit AcrB
MLLRRKKESHGPLQRFFNGFNRLFEPTTEVYVRWSGALIRKGATVLGLLIIWGTATLSLASRVPSSFLPDEDQGYFYVNMQLPSSASLERTSAATAHVEKILANTRASSTHPPWLVSVCSVTSGAVIALSLAMMRCDHPTMRKYTVLLVPNSLLTMCPNHGDPAALCV